MTLEGFEKQVKRLEDTYNIRNYPKPRVEIIWSAIRHHSDGVFERAVTHLIATHKTTPLVPEIQKAIEFIQAEDKQRAREAAFGTYETPLEALQYAQKKTTANPEFVQGCLRHLTKYLTGGINKKQFLEGCDMLDLAAQEFMRPQ